MWVFFFNSHLHLINFFSRVWSREVSRVKEFPAGNSAASSSRMAFLSSLCPLKKFKSMVRDFLLYDFSFFNLQNSRNCLLFRRTTHHGIHGVAEPFICLRIFILQKLLGRLYQLLRTTFWAHPFLLRRQLIVHCSSWGFSSGRFPDPLKLNLEILLNVLSIWLIHL